MRFSNSGTSFLTCAEHMKKVLKHETVVYHVRGINSIRRFMALLLSRNGVLHDHTGIYMYDKDLKCINLIIITEQRILVLQDKCKSHVNYPYLAVSEKDERLQELHTQQHNTIKRMRRLKEKLALAESTQ